MPKSSPQPCIYPRCGALVTAGRCKHHRREYPKREKTAARGYGSRWRRARAAYLQCNPLWVECERQGRTVAATVVDHITPHRGNTFLLGSVNDWQSHCALCHHSWKARIERGNG